MVAVVSSVVVGLPGKAGARSALTTPGAISAAVIPAVPAAPAVAAVAARPGVAPGAPGPITPLQPVDAGPDGHVAVERVTSPALQGIDPLPPVDPGPDASVAIDRVPVAINPPVTPAPLTLPLHPGQELVDATAADALATLGRAGRLTPGGAPDLDANGLQPQVASAQFLDPTHPVGVPELTSALLSGNIPPPLPVDPLALLKALPDGVPRLTYRLCSETATKPVSCSLTLPLGVPAILDVTGDTTPDVLADLLPAASVDKVTQLSTEVLSIQTAIVDVEARLVAIDVRLQNPFALLFSLHLLVERLRLQQTLADLRTQLQRKAEALTSLVNVGLALLAVRLPTSEARGGPLPAHVWAVYDLPGHKRLSIGFDGFRRGDTLPQGTLGVFTFDPVKASKGVYDVRGALRQSGAGAAFALTAGLASVAGTPGGEAVEPIVASIRFASPVPAVFDGHAEVDQAVERGEVDASTDRATHLDAQVLTNRTSGDRFTQLQAATLPRSVMATLTRKPDGSAATLDYRASATIDRALFADFEYVGARLDRALLAAGEAVPADVHLDLTSVGGKVTVNYRASSRLAALDAGFYDRGQSLVARGALRQLPSALSVLADLPTRHVEFRGEQALGSATLQLSRNLGDFAPLDGEHATFVTAGDALGVSARVTGLKSVDAFFDGHPRVTVAFDPGGQPFVAAGQVDGVQKARLEISNLPTTLSFDLDPVARKIAWRASTTVRRVQAAFVDTRSGPSVVAAVDDLPTSVDVTYDVGERPRVVYQASTVVPRVELFASTDPVETLDPNANNYLSTVVTGVPTTVDVLVDFPGRHLEGVMSGPLGAVSAVARFPVGGRTYLALAELTGVPARFDADFRDGAYRLRGLSGPVASAHVAVTNHGGMLEPTGVHLAAHFRQTTGDFDASARVRNLTRVEYARDAGGQTFALEADVGPDPLVVDVDVVLAAGGVDDTRLAAAGRITNLPASVTLVFADGTIAYRADRSVGLELEARIGKVAALSGLGAPLFDNGVAVVARGCDVGAGCAVDQSPFCGVFARCLGAVGTVRMPALPTSVVVDTRARTVALTGLGSPGGGLRAYVRLLGLLAPVPDLRVLATLTGLPSSLDLTVGPIGFSTGPPTTVDLAYSASAPLGALQVDADAVTTDAQFPVLRAQATVAPLPRRLHLIGQIGPVTKVTFDNSAVIDTVAVKVTGPTTGYLQAAVTGVPAQADVTVDFPGRHAQATMSSPLGGLTALAHIPSGGRVLSAAVDVRNVPGNFDADFADGNYRFRALSGALGHAALAVTNHSEAKALGGRHVAAHYRELTGDFDASGSFGGLTHAEYTTAGANQTIRLDAGAARVGIDVDVILARAGADDTRLNAAGFLETPNNLRIDVSGQKIVYRADRPVALLLEARVGKMAALAGAGAPLFAQGVAIHARGCGGGAGCVDDGSVFCTAFGPCFGAVATVSLPGLPSLVEVDMATRTVVLNGYRPVGGPLKAFVQLDGLLPEVSRLRALATIDGLPSPLDLTVGPFSFDTTKVTKLDVGYQASAPLGNIRVDADADTTTGFGTLRGRVIARGLPDRVRIGGQFGSKSQISTDNGGPIAELTAQVSAQLAGSPASGLVSFTDVPRRMTFDLSGFGPSALGVPTLTYDGHGVSTLDGLAQVEARLIEAFAINGTSIPLAGDAWARITNLGTTTTVKVNPDTSIRLNSTPGTGALAMGASVESALPNQSLDIPDLFDELGFEGSLSGHYGAPNIRIGGLSLVVSGLRSLSLVPSPSTSYLSTGLTGDYDHLAIDVADVFIDPDVDITLHVESPALVPNFDIRAVIQDPFTGIRFHLADNQLRKSGCFQVEAFGAAVAHLTISTLPGPTRTGVNRMDVYGADGDQTLNYIDPVPFPLGLSQALVNMGIDLLTAYVTHPFPPNQVDFDPGFGGC